MGDDRVEQKKDTDAETDYFHEPQQEGGYIPADADADPKVADGSVELPVQKPAPEITRDPPLESHTPPAAERRGREEERGRPPTRGE